MIADPRTDHPRVQHRLCAALRFVDAFTDKPITTPLEVRADTLPIAPGMPRLPWRAVSVPGSGIHRFLVTNDMIAPQGEIAIKVIAPGGEYVNHEPFRVQLPRPLVPHAPPALSSDFLVERRLWPTRALQLPPGETAIIAAVKNAGGAPVSGLRITMVQGRPVPAPPYAYTDAEGELVFRFPGLRKSAPRDGPRITTATLRIEARRPDYTGRPIAITSPVFPITIDLGQVTTLQITVA